MSQPPATATGQRERTPVDRIQVCTIPVLHPRQRPLPDCAPVTAQVTVFSTLDMREIVARLRQAAHAVGADAVVGVQIASSPSPKGSDYHYLMAMGTPVLLPWPEGHADPAEGLD